MQFEAGPTMETARYACAAAPLDADRVLVIGGLDETDLATTEILGAADEQETRRHRLR